MNGKFERCPEHFNQWLEESEWFPVPPPDDLNVPVPYVTHYADVEAAGLEVRVIKLSNGVYGVTEDEWIRLTLAHAAKN